MSDRFSRILDAATECVELAHTLEDNIQNWNQAVDDVFDVKPPRWRGPEADDARNKAVKINDFVSDIPFVTQLDTAAEDLCSWWEELVDTHNTQQYDIICDEYQRRINAHWDLLHELTAKGMGIFGDNPLSARERLRPPWSVRRLGGRPSAPNYNIVPVDVFVYYEFGESFDGDPWCSTLYRDYP